MGLDADESDARTRWQSGSQGRDKHRELGLVEGRGGEEGSEGGDGGTEFGGGLGCRVDGDVDGVGELEEFGGCCYAAIVSDCNG